ncbi:MAG: hypothetical protein H7318_02540 [Oligoflexus sp.]|nr:hypothetical protein [Oligoflexus sp.]
MGTKKYAGEGMYINEHGSTFLTRPMSRLKRILLRMLGQKPKDNPTMTRDFYAALTSEQSYVILGEERYGMSSRIASIRPKPNPPKRSAAKL